MGALRCGACETEHEVGSKFCDACGAALALSCPACQTAARPGAKFCGECGKSLTKAADLPEPPRPVLAVGERKQVTILFADIRGSTELIRGLDPEEALARIDPVIRAAAAAVTQFGGIVNEVQGDGIMALFGAPMAAEDHAVRACLAASTLLKGLPAGVEMRMGVHSGEVVIRPSGRDATDYTAIGPAVYLAKRLEQAADAGTVRLSYETAQRTRGYVDVRPLGPVQAKGWDEPVEMFELLAATDRPSWEVRAAEGLTPFVGRDLEVGALSSAMMRASLGRAQAVAVVADAGLGKSRLVHEFLQGAAARGVQVLRAAAASHSSEAPFHVAAELMRSWIGALQGDDIPALERRLGQAIAIGDHRDMDEPACRSLLDLPLPDPAAWQGLDPAIRRQRLLDACRRAILRGGADVPRIVLVEDLHWTDEASRALLEALVATAGAARLLLIATTRPEARPDWASRSYGAELRLAPLDPEQSEALLCTLVGAGPELTALRSRVVEGAEGTPLFLEEIARSLRDSGHMVAQASRVLTVPLEQISIPASVQAIVAARLDRLAPEPRRLLLTAAVIGKQLRTEVLRRVSRLPEGELQQSLQALEAAEFLHETSPGTGEDYSFNHAVTQSVAYEAILRAERRVLHARVFHAVLAVTGDRAGEATELLCEHAATGELWEQTAQFGLLAGERARGRYAWREAARFFERALDAQAHLPDVAATWERGITLRIGLRAALAAQGDVRRVGTLMGEASALALRLGDERRSAQLDGLSAMGLANAGELEQAVLVGERGLAAAARAGHVPTTLAVAFGLGQAHWYRGDFDGAIRTLGACLPDIRGPHRLSSAGSIGTASLMGLVCLSKAHAVRGEFEAAFALAAECDTLSAESGQAYDRAYAPLATGFAHLMQGDTPAAVVAFEAGLGIARQANIMLQVTSHARYLGGAYGAVGRFDEAYALLDEALAKTRELNLVGLTAWCMAGLAQVHLASGSPAADATVAAAGALASRYGYRPVQAICLRLAGDCHGTREEWADATERYRAAAQMLERLGMVPELIRAQLAWAHALERAGKATQAASLRDEIGGVAILTTGLQRSLILKPL